MPNTASHFRERPDRNIESLSLHLVRLRKRCASLYVYVLLPQQQILSRKLSIIITAYLWVLSFAARSLYCIDRLAKKAKKERQGKGTGGGGDAAGKGGAGAKSKKGPKPKMTKEERRAKYTQK